MIFGLTDFFLLQQRWLPVYTVCAIDQDHIIKFISNVFFKYNGLKTSKPRAFFNWVGVFFKKGCQKYVGVDLFFFIEFWNFNFFEFDQKNGWQFGKTINRIRLAYLGKHDQVKPYY